MADEPRYMGGQAVLEGVMMRGADTWAVSVRKEDGSIETELRDVAGWSERYRGIPIVRGVMGMAESLALGYKALTWSANQQMPEDEQMPEKAVGWTMAIAMIFFTGLFLVVPALIVNSLSERVEFLPFHLTEAVFRISLFLGYILLISRMSDIRRVFEYHGAEHKSIAAYENGVELTPDTAQQFSTAHVRCGTNFLLTVMVVAIVVYSFVPRPNLVWLVGSRILLIPLIAGVSYEVIRYAAKHIDKRWVRVGMRPGLALQRLTTREPDLDQLEVAIASLRAVMSADQVAEVNRRAGIKVPPIPPAIGLRPA